MKNNAEYRRNFESLTPAVLRNRLWLWCLERLACSPPRFSEANARRQIANTILRDLSDPVISPQQIQNSIGHSAAILMGRGVCAGNQIACQTKTGLIIISSHGRDRQQYWLARELGPDNAQVTRVEIHKSGTTSLTLNPDLPGVVNPHIINNQNFPHAAVATFNLLVGTLT